MRPSVHQSPIPTTKPRIIRNGHVQRVEKLIPIQLKSRVSSHTYPDSWFLLGTQ